MQRILCIDDDLDFLVSLRMQLAGRCRVITESNATLGLERLSKECFDYVLIDVGLGDENGIETVKIIKEKFPEVDVVMLSGQRDPKVVVQAIRAGASDYFTKPCSGDDLIAVFERTSRDRKVRDRYEALIAQQNDDISNREIVYHGKKVRQLLESAKQLKGHQANVLIIGETGTGKEFLARHLHALEDNPQRPFIAVNCAAIPEHLLESELFGVEKGAYTGATARRLGRFELADNGDIFLDEIGNLRLDLQAKLLRVLQEREYFRLGSSEPIKTNFRVLAATNVNLEEKVALGEFRMDLYHRLRVIQLTLPSLRERPEDIPALTSHFLSKHSKDALPKTISPAAMELLLNYAWPGNVRELENVVQSLIILSNGDVINESDLPKWALNGDLPAGWSAGASSFAQAEFQDVLSTLREHSLQAEKSYIDYVLNRVTAGDKTKAARILNVGRTTLYTKLKEFGML